MYGRKLRERSRFSPTMGDKPPLHEDSTTDEEEGGGNLRGTGTRETERTNGRGEPGADGDLEKKS